MLRTLTRTRPRHAHGSPLLDAAAAAIRPCSLTDYAYYPCRPFSASSHASWRSREERRLALHGNRDAESSNSRQDTRERARDKRKAQGVVGANRAIRAVTGSKNPRYLPDVSSENALEDPVKAHKRNEAKDKIKKTMAAVKDLPPLTDEDFQEIYQDLLTHDAAPPSPFQQQQLLQGSRHSNLLSLSDPEITHASSRELHRHLTSADGAGLLAIQELKEKLSRPQKEAEEEYVGAATNSMLAKLMSNRPSTRVALESDARSAPGPVQDASNQSSGEVADTDPSLVMPALEDSMPASVEQQLADGTASADKTVQTSHSAPHSRARKEVLQLLDEHLPPLETAMKVDSATNPKSAGYSRYQADRLRETVSGQEWNALLLGAAADRNLGDLEEVLRMMKRAYAQISEELLCATVRLLAQKRQHVSPFLRQLEELSIHVPPAVHHEIILGILRPDSSIRADSAVVWAERYLRTLEEARTPALPKTYAVVLKAIFKLRKSSSAIGVLEQGVRKRAWDLFAHARFVAHPKASVEMFDTMIYGCSLDDRIGAERALDMFIEMVEMGLQPTYYTYSGLIRTCARAKDPVFYFEALRLLKELLERGFKPQRDIFNSLLEGARPRGDLSRAKWIVGNMVNQSARGGDAAVAPNDATISNLFLTMATFSPAINRFVLNKKKPKNEPQLNVQEAKSKARDPSFKVASLSQETINSLYESDQERILSENGQESLSSQAGAQEGQNMPSTLLQDSVFTSVFPESSEDVLQQGRTILAAILQSKGLNTSILYPPPAANKSQGDPADFDAQQSQEAPKLPISPEISRILSEIRLTPLLLTSYLALLSAHSNIETTSHCFLTIFPALHVEYTHETWEAMFDKLDRQTGRRIARAAQSRELFSEWWDWLQERYERGNWDMGFVNRHVEMIYTRLINIESRAHKVDEAMVILEDFVERFPPSRIVSYAESIVEAASSSSSSTQPPTYLVQMSSFLYPETSDNSLTSRNSLPYVKSISLDKSLSSRPANLPPYFLEINLHALNQRFTEAENFEKVQRLREIVGAYKEALMHARELFLDAERRRTSAARMTESRKRLIGGMGSDEVRSGDGKGASARLLGQIIDSSAGSYRQMESSQ